MTSVFLAVWLAGCAGLPPNAGRTSSAALEHTDDTELGTTIAPAVAAHPGTNGIHPLPRGQDAFALRMVLIAHAQRSIDIQYYIWRTDITGRLLLDELWKAAERGVRIRLQLDDQVTRGMDASLAALDAHPNAEVRLFNPYMNRGFRVSEMVGDFSRINRRMHNKSFTVDNQVTIVGGRNVGDEYFSADPGLDFSDLDVAVMGPFVRDVSRQFDMFWNSEPSYPADKVIGRIDEAKMAEQRGKWRHTWEEPEAQRYIEAVRNTTVVEQLRERRLSLEWAHVKLVHDDPEKVLQPPDKSETHMLPRLEAAMGKPMKEVDLISPYFIPGEDGVRTFAALVDRGVKVRILTNSMVGTDASAAQAGYNKYRKDLLREHVVLYELKPSVAHGKGPEGKKDDGKKDDGNQAGSSKASLHAKTFAIDRRSVFVGSFNFDPRSAKLNTEMGALIESPVLAERLSSTFETWIPNQAYEVRLAADGGLEWMERNGETVRTYTSEPQVGFLRRMWIGFLGILPIESQL